MAKYGEVSLSRKKELEQPDEVIENLSKVFTFIIKHKIQIGIGLAVFFLLIIGIATTQYFSRVSESHASYLLDQGMNKLSEMQLEKKPVEISDQLEGDFKAIIDKYPGTVAGKFAMLQLANIYYAADKYDDAIGLYQKVIASFGQQKLFQNLIQMGLGLCHEAKGENAKAIAYFEKVIADPNGLIKDQALFNAGRIYGKMGNEDKRRDVYQKIITDYNSSLYVDIAKEYVSG